jgi:Small subunit of serine palmitoyltransferase-like
MSAALEVQVCLMATALTLSFFALPDRFTLKSRDHTTSTMATKQIDENVDANTSLFTTDLSLVYKPPRSGFRRFIWRWRMRFESTFALSLFEGWEKILVGTSNPPM